MSLPTFRELWRAVSDMLAAPLPVDPEYQRGMQRIQARAYEARVQIDIRAASIIQHMEDIAALNHPENPDSWIDLPDNWNNRHVPQWFWDDIDSGKYELIGWKRVT